jgi:hypothetical protein
VGHLASGQPGDPDPAARLHRPHQAVGPGGGAELGPTGPQANRLECERAALGGPRGAGQQCQAGGRSCRQPGHCRPVELAAGGGIPVQKLQVGALSTDYFPSLWPHLAPEILRVRAPVEPPARRGRRCLGGGLSPDWGVVALGLSHLRQVLLILHPAQIGSLPGSIVWLSPGHHLNTCTTLPWPAAASRRPLGLKDTASMASPRLWGRMAE